MASCGEDDSASNTAGQAKQFPRPAFVPFGTGNRQCIGEEFAWTEAIIVLATVASRWRIRPVPGVNVRMRPLTTLRPSELPMIPGLRRRPETGEVNERTSSPWR
jgi:cytochrome P450